MQLHHASSFSERPASDVLILPFWQEDKQAEQACPAAEFRSLYKTALSDFKGKEGEVLVLYKKPAKEKRLLLLGLGKENQCTPEALRKSYAAALKVCRKKRWASVSAALPKTSFPGAAAALEGLLLMNYAFDSLKSQKDELTPLVQKLCLVGIDAGTFKECRRTESVIKAVNFTRDLVNGNADDVTPQMLAKTAKDLEKESKAIKTTILDKKAIEKLGMGLLLAVNQGSHRDPVFVVVEYRGNPKSSDLTALVGKGITYDTGGLHLKTSGMETMKDDMTGAATVLGAIKAAAALGLKVNLLAAFPSTENAIGPRSFKLGDVYRGYNGKTVEIIDTDAEGRLVLADAVSYIEEKYKPKRIIDLATLTGGIIVALGDEASGIFSNDDHLAEALIRAGNHTYERLCRFPLYAEYKEPLKSMIADLKNATGTRKASSITGGIFIQEFIKKTPWAHLDIAGTNFLTVPRHYHSTNATGFGVRLLIDFLTHHEKTL
jgi:leucyl aminopeptidase